MATPIKTLPMAPGARYLLGALLTLAVLALIAAALTIPFRFESSSMFYKFGMDRMVLRTAKMAGLAAAVLLLLQPPLAGRLKWMDRIFSLPGLYRIHRFNAYAVGALVLIHPTLIQVSAHTWSIPLQTRYWPEWVGAVLMIVTLLQIGLSQWRRRLFRVYEKWLWIHGILAAVVFSALILHVLNVSESFGHNSLPRTWLAAVTLGSGLFWVWIRTHRLRSRKSVYRVRSVVPAGPDAFSVDLLPATLPGIDYFPGQFALISLTSPQLPNQFHPFTISSSPSRADAIQFTIRCCGDWTRRIGELREDDLARIQGPYGRFSHLTLHPDREIIMVAGGIGITPMLSMLRFMSDHEDPRRITLIWSNRSRAHFFGSDELEALQEKLTDFKWVPIFTREAPEGYQVGRLDDRSLEALLGRCGRDAAVFLCGPPEMVMQIRSALKRIGFSHKAIYTEAFGY
jgi:predicted ferric reductase